MNCKLLNFGSFNNESMNMWSHLFGLIFSIYNLATLAATEGLSNDLLLSSYIISQVYVYSWPFILSSEPRHYYDNVGSWLGLAWTCCAVSTFNIWNMFSVNQLYYKVAYVAINYILCICSIPLLTLRTFQTKKYAIVKTSLIGSITFFSIIPVLHTLSQEHTGEYFIIVGLYSTTAFPMFLSVVSSVVYLQHWPNPRNIMYSLVMAASYIAYRSGLLLRDYQQNVCIHIT